MEIFGAVAPRFEPVRQVFTQGAGDLGEGGGAFCVYLHGEKVIDLWAGAASPGVPWGEQTATMLMSSTKALSTLCLQILHERGQVDLEAPVARYWPEFAAAGKARITVRQVLSHTSGVATVDGHQTLLSLDDGTGWDATGSLEAALAGTAPSWEPGTRHGYHALTFGWLVGALVRRISGRSLGAFLEQEVRRPLGLDHLCLGTPPALHPRLAVLHSLASLQLPERARAAMEALLAAARDEHTVTGRAFVARGGRGILDTVHVLGQDARFRAAEQGAANATGTARSVARLYALLAGGGALDGLRLVSPASIERFSREQVNGPDAVLGVPSQFALGYMRNWGYPGLPRRFGPSDDAFGHAGAGGQIGFCDPVRGLGVGFVRSHLTLVGTYASALADALYACLG
jgi:CubicO group peptidase (beta-lactamase class C family)